MKLRFVKYLVIIDVIVNFDIEINTYAMGLLCSLLLLLVSSQLFAQGIKGTVIDIETKIPVSLATVKTANLTIYTDYDGRFEIKGVHFGDTARISHPRYRSLRLTFNTLRDTVLVYMKSTSILLQEVDITSTRNFIKDSLRMRKEFASVFDHKAPTIKDLFTFRSPYGSGIKTRNARVSTTTSIVGVNLLNVIPYITRNRSRVSRLQKVLLDDEENNYVKRRFSKDRVIALTKLKGDSLENFMSKYFPSTTKVQKMTDYDVLMYIKESYNKFVKLTGTENVALQP